MYRDEVRSQSEGKVGGIMQHNTSVDVAMECLLRATSEEDLEERQHCRRVEKLCEMTAVGMGWEAEDISNLKLAALLHHMDMTRVPESALAPGITAILRQLELRLQNPASESRQLIVGRTAEAAALISVVDRFDRLVSNQRYRNALSDASAIEILRYDADTPLEKAAVEAFSRTYTATYVLPKAA